MLCSVGSKGGVCAPVHMCGKPCVCSYDHREDVCLCKCVCVLRAVQHILVKNHIYCISSKTRIRIIKGTALLKYSTLLD